MHFHGNGKIGRNDPCPCGSGKKYKRCCLEQQTAAYRVWAQQRDACEQLTQDMLRFAERKLGDQIDQAWQDFNMTSLPVPFDAYPGEDQVFIPYFLFQWHPRMSRSGEVAGRRQGIVTRWYEQERSGKLSDRERLFLEQATTQPLSFFEVLWTEAGERMGLRDILVGTEAEVVERSASRMLQRGDITYSQIWNLGTLSILGCTAPIRIPPSWKGELIALRKKLRKKVAKQNRDLNAEELLRRADAIRLTYLKIRDGLYTAPLLANTDGDPLVFHTLKFRIESPEAAFDALAPLALLQSKEELLEDARFGKDGRLHSVEFAWRRKGNAKIPSWDNTTLGDIKIVGRSLIAEVNSENRAKRLRSEIEKRLGSAATHESTSAQTAEEMLAQAPKRSSARKKEEMTEALLADPEAKKQLQQIIQEQTEDWIHQKVPALGGRTPFEAVHDPDGKEVVEALLLDWERSADAGAYQAGIRPDFNAVRKLLNLPSSAS